MESWRMSEPFQRSEEMSRKVLPFNIDTIQNGPKLCEEDGWMGICGRIEAIQEIGLLNKQ